MTKHCANRFPRYLGLHGYKVLEASNGAEALHIANQHAGSIQVLITDMILPKMQWRRSRSGGRQNVSTDGDSLHVWLH